jgi:hypothetical protein
VSEVKNIYKVVCVVSPCTPYQLGFIPEALLQPIRITSSALGRRGLLHFLTVAGTNNEETKWLT